MRAVQPAGLGRAVEGNTSSSSSQELPPAQDSAQFKWHGCPRPVALLLGGRAKRWHLRYGGSWGSEGDAVHGPDLWASGVLCSTASLGAVVGQQGLQPLCSPWRDAPCLACLAFCCLRGAVIVSVGRGEASGAAPPAWGCGCGRRAERCCSSLPSSRKMPTCFREQSAGRCGRQSCGHCWHRGRAGGTWSRRALISFQQWVGAAQELPAGPLCSFLRWHGAVWGCATALSFPAMGTLSCCPAAGCPPAPSCAPLCR